MALIVIAMLDYTVCGYQRDEDRQRQTRSQKQLHLHTINPLVALNKTKP